MPVYRTIAELTDDPVLASLHRYWDGKRGGRAMPERRDIDPIEIERAVLPFVVIAEYLDHGSRIRYRLVGTEMVEFFGMDFTGRCTDEIMTGSYLEFINSLFGDVREERAAIYSESIFRWDASGHRWTRRLFLPLGDHDVRMVLIGQTFGGTASDFQRPEIAILRSEYEMEEVMRGVLAQ